MSADAPPRAPAPLRGNDVLTIGQLAERTGLSVSAIRFYETKHLVSPVRNKGGQRRYLRSDIRRLSFVLIAQQLGFSIEKIRAALSSLPERRTPTQKDWEQISRAFRSELDQRIGAMTRLRDHLDGCIGCGCLSLKRCQLYNPADRLHRLGSGPRIVLGDGASGT
ncbi:MAG TPA: redox-sensitive transcriptional activator SoxR [Hyphomonadaceae bacterium]|nr:redox-sensitive transcriptional activator SoxR [Hyphomonadaceae bacterium]